LLRGAFVAKNADLIRRWFEEVWNQGRAQTIHEMCAKDAVGYGQAQHGADIHGPEQFEQFWRTFRGAFSGIKVEIHDTVEEDDRVVARWTMTMTHTAPFLGLQPMNKTVSVNGMSMQRFKNGQIVAGWDNWDQLGLMVQLGAVPAPKLL
jgi:steroid delta-isomerase-like uncharacterized protein